MSRDTDRIESKTYNVDEDSSKNGARDGLSISGIIHASDELLVAGSIQGGEDGEDDDGEEGDDGAVQSPPRRLLAISRFLLI